MSEAAPCSAAIPTGNCLAVCRCLGKQPTSKVPRVDYAKLADERAGESSTMPSQKRRTSLFAFELDCGKLLPIRKLSIAGNSYMASGKHQEGKMNLYRTHTCGELGKKDTDNTARIAGWLSTKRHHGGIMFIDLRDFYGTTQVILQTPDVSEATIQEIEHLNLESVLSISGIVRPRPSESLNPKMQTGEIELVARSITILSASVEPPPFPITKGAEVREDLRLHHRYLDLRRPKMRDMLVQRGRFCQIIRESMLSRGFLEVHTPILSNSSPEGARDFIIPSRLHPGKFFALPQAPQQWKQTLIASGVDRYFQIAPCFRDEPARADRTPGEFYQLDIEMAFVEQEDILCEVESIILEIGQQFSTKKILSPFPRLKYKDALERYGSDKPDTRFGLELQTLTPYMANSSVRFLQESYARKETIKGLAVPGGSQFSRRDIGSLEEIAKESGISRLAWLVWAEEGPKGSLAGIMEASEIEYLRQVFKAQTGTLALLCSGPGKRVDTTLNAIRLEIGNRLGLRNPNELLFTWILDFPIYEQDDESGQTVFSHNPFSMPRGGLEAFNTLSPLEIIGEQYDLTCNGTEISSGAIRNNTPEGLYRAFEIAGYSRTDVEKSFGHMIRMFKHGCPPHGGIAPGLERLLMFFLGETSIREVVPFPKNQLCEDTMIGAPSKVSSAQLRELQIKIIDSQ